MAVQVFDVDLDARSSGRMSVRRLALLVAAVVGLAACGSAAAAPPPASGPAPQQAQAAPHAHAPATSGGFQPAQVAPVTPVPAQAPPATPADLRVGFESLLGHHATLVNRLVRTVLRGDPDLVEAANQALVLNTEDLTGVITDLHGQAAGDEFESLWASHTDYLVDYARGVADGDQAGRDAARAALDHYRTAFGAFVEGASGGRVSAADVAGALGPHVDHLTGFADAFHAGDFGRAYELQRQAFAHMFPTAQVLAAALADPASSATPGDTAQELRSNLGLLLGEHLELMVDAMRAAVVGAPEFDAAAAALGANQAQLTGALDSLVGAEQAAQFNEAWAHHIELLVRYSVAVADGDTAAAENLRVELVSVRDRIAASFSALTGGAIPVEAAAVALAPHDELLVDQVEAYADGDYPRAHQLAFEGYQHMFHTVAAVAPAIESYLASRAPVGGAQTGGGGLAAPGRG